MIIVIILFNNVLYSNIFMFITEKYFDMNKKQCRDALDIYKKFLSRTDRVIEFLKVAEVCITVRHLCIQDL